MVTDIGFLDESACFDWGAGGVYRFERSSQVWFSLVSLSLGFAPFGDLFILGWFSDVFLYGLKSATNRQRQVIDLLLWGFSEFYIFLLGI